jgi:hypothetical protein
MEFFNIRSLLLIMNISAFLINGLTKPLCILAMLLCSSCGAQDIKQNYAREQYRNMPQDSVKTDTPRRGMPVVKPDTTTKKPMPVAKPPADIQYK